MEFHAVQLGGAAAGLQAITPRTRGAMSRDMSLGDVMAFWVLGSAPAIHHDQEQSSLRIPDGLACLPLNHIPTDQRSPDLSGVPPQGVVHFPGDNGPS